MEKTATMNLRINPLVKQGAEEVLKELGIPMATAIDIYLRQIAITKGLPFPVVLKQETNKINADEMTTNELRKSIMLGYDEMDNGDTEDAETAFKKFRREHI